ncbi:MAG: hypothetical protein HXY34_00615 [Candidatus Thorarchaeota archaeon]|nr:hypothetical protein [Candidatus Thorarchaeota archaeon]
MVIRLVARVKLENMESAVLYPREESNDERIALLTGIVQLVSAALEHAETTDEGQPMFMKSERGVIGYATVKEHLFICEGDGERETGDALKAIVKRPLASNEELSSSIDDLVKKRGKEIGDLWR